VRVGVLAVLVTAGFALRWTVFRPQPIPVTAVPVGRGTVEDSITNSRAGTVEARRRAKLSPQVGGLVTEIPHREGARVAAGEVLLRLDDRLQRSELELARRELAAARARRDEACLAAERAERDRTRQQRLADDAIISEDLLDQAVTAAETSAAACTAARATVESAAGQVALAETQLAQTVLRAPFDGIVADVWIETGEWATPAPPAVPVPPVLDLIDPSSLSISAPMDEVDAGKLHPGLPVRVSVDSRPGETFPGRVTRVAPYVEDAEEQNRTVEIEVTLEIPSAVDLSAASAADARRPDALLPTLLPGTSADVEVILATRDGVLRIPTLTLVEGHRVLVVDKDSDGAGDTGTGILATRAVETGLSNWDWTEVTEGLAPGALVVTSLDRTGVEEGALVEVEAEVERTADQPPAEGADGGP